MEQKYNDEIMPDDFEQIAKAYSANLKKNGFIFIRLEEEEFKLLLSEVFIIIEKMKSCLDYLRSHIDSKQLKNVLIEAEISLTEKFECKKKYKFRCISDKNQTFLGLIGLENLLILKLMLLSVKSGELDLCNKIITSITSIFVDSFSQEGFIIEN